MKWHKLLRGALCSLWVFIILAGMPVHAEATANALGERTLDDYRRDGVTIAALSVWKPFSFRNEAGEQVGYLVDLWRTWSKKTGVPVRFAFSNWPTTLENMKSGTADIHSGVFFSEERDAYLDFSNPIQSSSTVLATRNNGNVDCDNALMGSSVAVVSKTYAQSFLRKNYPDADIHAYSTVREALGALRSGKVDALVGDNSSVLMWGSRDGGMENVTICRTLFERDVLAAVNEGNTNLLAIVNNGFAAITPDELEDIEERWFITVADDGGWTQAVVPAAIVLMFIGGMVFLWVTRRA